jgi:hypothetical protein
VIYGTWQTASTRGFTQPAPIPLAQTKGFRDTSRPFRRSS